MTNQLRKYQKWSIFNLIKKIYYKFYLPGNPDNLYIEKSRNQDNGIYDNVRLKNNLKGKQK